MNLNLITKTINLSANSFDNEVGFSDFEIKKAESEPIPAYACISYTWGEEFISHPYDKSINISKRTLPVLETAISLCQSLQEKGERKFPLLDHYWMDSLCMTTLKEAIKID